MTSRIRHFLPLLLLALSTSACYHAVIDLGRPESSQVIDIPWALSFVGGLIPPPAVETASKCPNGVAKVVTEHSFLNSVAAIVSSGIVTPMHITITCAAAGQSASSDAPVLRVSEGATVAERAQALEAAVRISESRGGAAYVEF